MIQAIDLTQKQTQFLYLIVSQSTALRRIREVYVFGTIDQITMKVQRKCGGEKSGNQPTFVELCTCWC